ncbi:hypothetical protein [Sphingobium xenophagum]|uniref:hypothetical protein n=1 Tax=Sphingobium xenophagum TaxID=121428 RepID=UPI0004747444|nr:hypothetical protein [Sphingobium xenophagum]
MKRTDRTPPPNPYEKRRAGTDRKLRAALERLIEQRPSHPVLQNGYRLEVATLAREAGVGRNAIYTNHRSVIDALKLAAARAHPKAAESLEEKVVELRAVIREMQANERKLLTQNAALLQRATSAEADAERYRRQNARLAAARNDATRPIPIGAGTQNTR